MIRSHQISTERLLAAIEQLKGLLSLAIRTYIFDRGLDSADGQPQVLEDLRHALCGAIYDRVKLHLNRPEDQIVGIRTYTTPEPDHKPR